MADQTTTIPSAGKTPETNGSLDITVAESEWAFTAGDFETTIQLICDAVWLYASQAGGSYIRIPAGATFNVTFPSGSAGGSVFVKANSGTGTIYMLSV